MMGQGDLNNQCSLVPILPPKTQTYQGKEDSITIFSYETYNFF